MPTSDDIRLVFWELRRETYAEHRYEDNARRPAGDPMTFQCPACRGPIILPEDFLTRPKVCYDCRDLVDAGLIFEMPPPGTGWNRRR